MWKSNMARGVSVPLLVSLGGARWARRVRCSGVPPGEVLPADAQLLLPGPACDQGLPHVRAGHHRAARGFLHHVHPSGGPGDFRHALPREGRRHSPRGLRTGFPEAAVGCSLFHSYYLQVGPPAAFSSISSRSAQPAIFLSLSRRIRKVWRKETLSLGGNPHPAQKRPLPPLCLPPKSIVRPPCHRMGQVLRGRS